MTYDLPPRFPCWCRAIYSWGGEVSSPNSRLIHFVFFRSSVNKNTNQTKRDLGFIEGDLIECLNAGDGSWWMGRLKRDRRMVGLFPSNFVEVLDESFQPQSKTSFPLPSKGADNHASNNISIDSSDGGRMLNKPKKKFRKPFQAYYAAGSRSPDTLKKEVNKSISSNLKSASTGTLRRMPFSSMKNNTQSRSASPARPNLTPACSDNIIQATPSRSRSRSPLPPVHHNLSSHKSISEPTYNLVNSRVPSPVPNTIEDSPSPPPPPPHRVIYNRDRQPSSNHFTQQESKAGHASQTRSPLSSNFRDGRTPSPLRDAMNEVMTSLEDMSVDKKKHFSPGQRVPDIWSPEAYDQLYMQANKNAQRQAYWNVEEGHRLEDTDQENVNVANDYQGPHELSESVEGREDGLRGVEITDYHIQPHPDVSSDIPAPASKWQFPAVQSETDHQADITPEQKSRLLRNRRSAFEVSKDVLSRTFTAKSTITSASSTAQSSGTNSSGNTQMTSQSLMSGYSAGGFSATSAGSFARRNFGTGHSVRRPISAMDSHSKGFADCVGERSDSSFTGITYHSSHDSHIACGSNLQGDGSDNNSPLGAFGSPKPKKSGFFKKMVESAKTGAASARSAVGTSSVRPQFSNANLSSGGLSTMSSQAVFSKGAAANTSGGDWVQVRRDVNRSNSLSRNERSERADRCQLNDMPVIFPVDELFEAAEGDEGLNGFPVSAPMEISGVNFALVDKSSRFTNTLPSSITPATLAQGYLCRPYRSDVQRLRAIYTWLSERISWEDDFEGDIELNRVLQAKRACSREISTLVVEMCASIGIHAETVRGYLKAPGEILDFEMVARPNHWWNAVIVDGEWRIMDCSLASPTNPQRSAYSYAGAHVAEGWWFLARPMEICYTHVPLLPEQQHICPQLPHEVLMALPCACPPYFKHNLQLYDFDTSLLHLEGLEMAHIQFLVPDDVECVAEVEARAFQQDVDGDYFESGDIVVKKALAQAEWIDDRKKYTVKALLPGDEGQGVLKVYAGKRGLMVSQICLYELWIKLTDYCAFMLAFYQVESPSTCLCSATCPCGRKPTI